MRGLPGVSRFLATWRVLALATVLAVVTAVVGVSPGIASASSAAHRPARHGVHAAAGSGLTLAQAPTGLRAAVRRTLGAPAVAAGSAFQKGKLTASDGLAHDNFGWSVALSGSTAVVGAYGKNSFRGAAYVFVHSGSTWFQQAKLTAADGAAHDNFGWSVALSGSTAVVGAYGKNSSTGAAYVFVRSSGTWFRQAKLTAADGATGDDLGYSVALSGSTALVGAIGGNSFTGAAYVFVRSGRTWSQQAKLTAADGASGDQSGVSVALSGSTAIVGAPGSNSLTGAAYVFTGSGSTWTQRAKLTASHGAANDFFGHSVALSGTTTVAGAYGNNSNTGAAFVFVLPSQQAKLTASLGAPGDTFGSSVALSGSTAIVGAPAFFDDRGAVYVFVRSGSTWTQQAKLTASDGASGDIFGSSVALSGSTVVVGAPDNQGTGAAYVFTGAGDTWTQQAKLTASDGARDDLFGHSVALSGPTAIVGAFSKNSFTGAAYVFTGSGSSWTQQAELTASDGAAHDNFGVSVALSGSTAIVGAISKNSSTGAAYVFTGSGSSWTQQAELTASDGASGDFFGVSVALSGSTAIVGADGKSSSTGAVYVFARSGSTWSEQIKLTASDGAPGDSFGVSLAIAKSTAVVGAPGNNSGIGAAYVFVNV